MRVVKLTDERVPAFKKYFRLNSKEQDESYPLPGDYKPESDEPAYLLLDDDDSIAGAAALMLYREYREANTGRFRIFHCIRKEVQSYKLLLDEILSCTNGLRDIYCFVEDCYSDVRDIWECLGFRIKRYSWVLKRTTKDFNKPVFPAGFELRDFRSGLDEQNWCDLINESFANMQGHVQMYPSKIEQWRKDPSFLSDGMKLLWHENKAVATMALSKENEEGEDIIFIDSVGVLNSYQGGGLGKNLIRAGIEYAGNSGTNYVMLSVNAENERATDLYLREGFSKDALILCYSLLLQNLE